MMITKKFEVNGKDVPVMFSDININPQENGNVFTSIRIAGRMVPMILEIEDGYVYVPYVHQKVSVHELLEIMIGQNPTNVN